MNERIITAEGVNSIQFAISPDGKQVAIIGPDQKPALLPVDGGEVRAIPGLDVGDAPIGWSGDGRFLVDAQPRRAIRTVGQQLQNRVPHFFSGLNARDLSSARRS